MTPPDGTEAEAQGIVKRWLVDDWNRPHTWTQHAEDRLVARIDTALRARTDERESARDSFHAEHRMHVETVRVSEVVRQERDRLAERLKAVEEAVKDAFEFLEHSGNQRAVLSGKFSTPSARYDWFNRVKVALRALQAGARGREGQS